MMMLQITGSSHNSNQRIITSSLRVSIPAESAHRSDSNTMVLRSAWVIDASHHEIATTQRSQAIPPLFVVWRIILRITLISTVLQASISQRKKAAFQRIFTDDLNVEQPHRHMHFQTQHHACSTYDIGPQCWQSKNCIGAEE